MWREVCKKVIEKKGKMVGKDEEKIKIDEDRFDGKSK
jgi:hypothetical protein